MTRTIAAHAIVSGEGILRLEVPCDMPPGPVDVVVVVVVNPADVARPRPAWEELYGLGRDVWEGVDAVGYVRELRADRDGMP